MLYYLCSVVLNQIEEPFHEGCVPDTHQYLPHSKRCQYSLMIINSPCTREVSAIAVEGNQSLREMFTAFGYKPITK